MKKSAGILLYRVVKGGPQVMLVHPGGPFWAKKDEASWSIPKGELDEGEDPLEAARREFHEETGVLLNGDFISLTSVKQKSGKLVLAWAFEGDLDVSKIRSNVFEMEWPPRSGRKQQFPEIDKGAWLTLDEARKKIIQGQSPILDELALKMDWTNA